MIAAYDSAADDVPDGSGEGSAEVDGAVPDTDVSAVGSVGSEGLDGSEGCDGSVGEGGEVGSVGEGGRSMISTSTSVYGEISPGIREGTMST